MATLIPSAVLGNGTLANLNAPYYSGGGGGGGTSTFVVATTNVLNVSSIQGNGGSGVEINGGATGITLSGAGGTFVSAPGLFFPVNGTLDFQDNNGALTGVSSINGAVYPPAGGAGAAISTLISGGTNVGSAPQNLVPTGPTLSTGKVYLFSATFDSPSQNVIGAPNSGDHMSFVMPDTTIPFTLDLTQFAAQKAKGQPLGFSFSAPFVAGAGAFQLTAYCNAASGASTFVGASSPGWIIPLN